MTEFLAADATRYAYILIAGTMATAVWRAAGVTFAGRVSEDSEIFRWVRAVATALVAALIARLILFPAGALAETPVWLRIGAGAIGFAVALGGRRWTFIGIVVAECLLLGGWYAMSKIDFF